MSTNNHQIVKELDTRYAIALGFCADGDPDDVYNNVEDARAQNEGRTPSVGFVVIDRQTGEWADFAMQAFAYYEGALQCYNEHMEQPDVVPALLLIPLDENVALTLYHEDLSSELCPNGYTFTFCDSKSRMALVNEPSFPTCDEALAYYEKHLKAGESEDDTQVITDFSGEYGFLNNGYVQIDHPIHIFGRDFYTAEGAFQSQKCPEQADSFRDATGRSAKALGKHVPLHSDWDSIKDLVMAEVLLAKFSQNDILRQKLLSTGDVRIEPHNTRHDNYWGNCQCAECAWKKKENRLGTILMRIREKLR